jgi:two-component system, LuxR family, response regulator FixJ
MATATATPTVYIVDDDPQVCESLSLMVRSVGLDAKTYQSAEAFLDDGEDAAAAPRCMVLDVRMPGLSGLGLQQTLVARNLKMPIIMISGCADIPMAVQAMSAGALDFLEKPFSRRALLSRIQEAIDLDAGARRQCAHKAELTGRVEKLSARQREVLDLLVAGKHSKQIASELGIGEKTVAKHRAGVLEKMQVDNVVELVRLFASAG